MKFKKIKNIWCNYLIKNVCFIKIYKNEKLYYKGPAMVVWPAGIFHRIISGAEGSISVNFATRYKNFDINDIDIKKGTYDLTIRHIFSYHYDKESAASEEELLLLVEESRSHAGSESKGSESNWHGPRKVAQGRARTRARSHKVAQGRTKFC